MALAAGALIVASACSREPDVFMPPVQRQPILSDQAPMQAKRWVRMSDGEADAYIVSDIAKGDQSAWRWTGKRPTMRFYLTGTAGWKFSADFSIAEATFKDTGPVTLQFLANGQVVDTQRYDKPGNYKIEKAVPPSLLKANADNDVAIEIDKVWLSPSDGAKLGVLLTSLGFTR